MVLGWLRGNASSAQNGKVIDGAHPEQATAEANALKPDLLPDDQNKDGTLTRHNILVAIKGTELDREIMSLACKVALQKKNATIYIVYVIEVPRAKAIDDPMTDETKVAKQALLNAAIVAQNAGVTSLQREIVQSRDQGHSLVDEVEAHQCKLLIVGIPYREDMGGQIEGVDAVAYVLQHAPSKVWVVRDRPHDQAHDQAHDVVAATSASGGDHPAARSGEHPIERTTFERTVPAPIPSAVARPGERSPGAPSEEQPAARPAEHVARR